MLITVFECAKVMNAVDVCSVVVSSEFGVCHGKNYAEEHSTLIPISAPSINRGVVAKSKIM